MRGKTPLLQIDGSQGEGGGQILRTALALSTCLNQPFRISKIRANRQRPGLQPQHLAAVKAAAAISNATVVGADRDSQTLEFIPGKITAGHYHFDIGTAGSTTLVMQTVLPALLLCAHEESVLHIDGGTHNPLAPPFEFIHYAFLPLLRQMGATVTVNLDRPGFSPLGGGRLTVNINPLVKLTPLHLMERGDIRSCHAEVLLVNLPVHIAERELTMIGNRLSLSAQNLHYTLNTDAVCTGNSVAIVVQSTHITECITALGKKGLSAERVAEQATAATESYLAADIPVGSYLADQMLLYLALAGYGSFMTVQPSSHTLTNIAVIEHFMAVSLNALPTSNDSCEISCIATG